jgi:hypothetical protein
MNPIIYLKNGDLVKVEYYGSHRYGRKIYNVHRKGKSIIRYLQKQGITCILTDCNYNHDKDKDLNPTHRYIQNGAKYIRSHKQYI